MTVEHEAATLFWGSYAKKGRNTFFLPKVEAAYSSSNFRDAFCSFAYQNLIEVLEKIFLITEHYK